MAPTGSGKSLAFLVPALVVAEEAAARWKRQRAAERAEMTTLILHAFCMGRQENLEAQREAEVATELADAQRRAEVVGREEQEVQLQDQV